jgi:hypothetical protein
MKSEGGNPKSEKRPKLEIRNSSSEAFRDPGFCLNSRRGYGFGFRAPAFVRISDFGFRSSCGPRLLTVLILAASSLVHLQAQAPDVPIYKQGRKESERDNTLNLATKELFATTNVIKLAEIKAQLKRTNCQLQLPKPNTKKLTPRELCDIGRQSHLRVGWAYLCDKCTDWHVNLAGGYVLTADGAVATCYHVVTPDREIKAGCLVAADEDGKLFPVTEILAANRYSDAAIVRVTGTGFKPLPLNTNVHPGDPAYCFSDPLYSPGYFSDGVVNRFYQFPGRRPFGAAPTAAFAPTRINVGTDWAPGSSGSAVLDECGNAIGHVSTIGAVSDEEEAETDQGTVRFRGPTMIVFHEAVAARDVLSLVTPREK